MPSVDDAMGLLCPPPLLELAEGCSHGPDPHTAFHHNPATPTDAPITPVCSGDGVDGRRVQVVYARSDDRPDRYPAEAANVSIHARVADAIVLESAREAGGERRIRFVHGANCGPITVANAVMSPAGDDSFTNTVTALRALGHNRTDRLYMVFLDAQPGFCGQGHMPSDERPGPENSANNGNRFGITASNCWNGNTAAHELMHNLGGVQLGAPHTSGAGHCTDEWDRMCYDDEGAPGVTTVCANSAHDHRFDCNHDDYFHTDPPGGSWLAGHWNTADNQFLLGAPGIRVRPSSGSSFGAESAWSNVRFHGSRGNFVADVTGDGRADAVAWNDDTLWVQAALLGGGFGAPAQWSDPVGAFHGNRGNFVADVTGDGRADAVAWNDDTLWVRQSTGGSFAAPTQWSDPVGAFYGSRGNFVADVTGDGRADAVAWNDDTLWVRQATATSTFSSPAQWAVPVSVFVGSLGNFVADVTGDGRADAVAWNGR
ncbi:MAG TPA: VCBS repeat-containing protein [Acidimicrobiales bacterium]|nr:VCBS repeat-containing protein [Acidimicrobiales bacterium]